MQNQINFLRKIGNFCDTPSVIVNCSDKFIFGHLSRYFFPYLIIKFTSCYSLSLRVTCLTIISNTDMLTYLSKGLSILCLQPTTTIAPLNKRLPNYDGLEDYTKFITLRLW